MSVVRALLGGATLFVIVVGLAACAGGGAAASISPPPGADVSIDARNLRFDRPELTVPTGEPFDLFFRNLDGAPHNVAIYADPSASQSIYVGEIVTDAAVTYSVPAMEPGVYFFRCDVHPDMVGMMRTRN